jgi:choice-of-anchor A domain-containing protein
MPHLLSIATLFLGLSLGAAGQGTPSGYRTALRALSPVALFASGDVEYSCSNIDGPVAVAGDVRMAHMGVNGQGKETDMGLQVGKSLHFRDGSIRGTGASLGGATAEHFDAHNILSAGYSNCSSGAFVNCLSFYSLGAMATRLAEYRRALELASKDLASQPSPLAQLSAGDELNLSALRGLNFFSVTGAQLTRVRKVRINGFPSSRVILNVQDGGPTSLANLGNDFTLQGMPGGSVLLNFPQAKQVTLHHSNLPASVLAPGADVVFTDGRIDGALYAGGRVSASPSPSDFDGESFHCTGSGGQVHWIPFTLP